MAGLSYQQFIGILQEKKRERHLHFIDAPIYRSIYRSLVEAGIIESKGDMPEEQPDPFTVHPVEKRLRNLEERVKKLEEQHSEAECQKGDGKDA